MELKKSNEANIDKLRLPITLMGLLFVGSIVLASFSYTEGVQKELTASADTNVANLQYLQEAPPDQPDVIEPPQVDATPPPQEEIVEEENTEEIPAPSVPVPPPVNTGPVDVVPIKQEIIEFPDVEAAFPGGPAALQRWIIDHVQYPQTSVEMNEQGKVYLSFVVKPDGSISDIAVERGVSSDLDREAKRLVRQMPKWIAGEQTGKKVATRCRLPINFVLN